MLFSSDEIDTRLDHRSTKILIDIVLKLHGEAYCKKKDKIGAPIRSNICNVRNKHCSEN